MKLPYSYRQNFFVPVLAVSLAGHALAFVAGSGWLSLAPEFDVRRASSSMEVVIAKTEKTNEPAVELTRIMTAETATETVKVKDNTPQPKKEIKKSVYVPPAKGAAPRKVSAYQNNPAPVYPERARAMGWEGVVLLRVFVQSNGRPGQVEVEQSSGHEVLDKSAVRAVQKWRFKPAGIGDLSFSAWVRIPVRFTLVDKS